MMKWDDLIENIFMKRSIRLLTALCMFNYAGTVVAKTIFTPYQSSKNAKPNSEEALNTCLKSRQTHLQKLKCFKSTIQFCISTRSPPDWNDLNESNCEFEELSLWEKILNERSDILSRTDKLSQEAKSSIAKSIIARQAIRDQYCSVFQSMQGSYLHRQVETAECLLFITASETVEVDILLDELNR